MDDDCKGLFYNSLHKYFYYCYKQGLGSIGYPLGFLGSCVPEHGPEACSDGRNREFIKGEGTSEN